MKKYIFDTKKVNTIDVSLNSVEENRLLKDYGERGWNLCGVVNYAFGNYTIYYFSKEIIEQPK